MTEITDHVIYPLEAGTRGDRLGFVLFQHGRFLDSGLRRLCSLEVVAAAMILQMEAFRAYPVGTLPDDPEELAAILTRGDLVAFEALRAPDGDASRGCLRGWYPVHVSGYADGVDRVRLGHGVVTEVALKAVKAFRQGDEGGIRSRLSRLRKTLKTIGGTRAAEDESMVEAIDRRLCGTGVRRTALAVREAWEAESLVREGDSVVRFQRERS